MRYRIRYEQRHQHYMTEIEAHSPAEAVVKFQHLKHTSHGRPDSAPQVRSVSVADAGQAWT
jgi:hypothetical protein